MTSNNQDSEITSDELSDEQRSAIFAQANLMTSRPRSQKIGKIRLPPRYVRWVAAVFLVLGVGGQLADHFLGLLGGNTQVPKGQMIPLTPTPPSHLNATQSLDAFMRLKPLSAIPAPPFTLRTTSDQRWVLAAHRGRVVVLTFFDAKCIDICPVLGAEIRQADRRLGSASSKVVFAIVNTDPKHTATLPTPRALSVPHLVGLPDVTFLTGSLSTLNTVWSHYGIYIKVGAKTNQISHNNLLYFIAPNGDLAALAEPFSHESKLGVYSLNVTDIRRYAKGIALTADSLIE